MYFVEVTMFINILTFYLIYLCRNPVPFVTMSDTTDGLELIKEPKKFADYNIGQVSLGNDIYTHTCMNIYCTYTGRLPAAHLNGCPLYLAIL